MHPIFRLLSHLSEEEYEAFITQNYQGVEGYDSGLLVYRLRPEGG
ncbi:MAG: hypothetical protein ACO4AJ_08460 [Prochlorothrix sp.]